MRKRYIDSLTRRTVLVHTKSGKSFKGVLSETYIDCIVLVLTKLYVEDRETLIDGEVGIQRQDIDFFQVITEPVV